SARVAWAVELVADGIGPLPGKLPQDLRADGSGSDDGDPRCLHLILLHCVFMSVQTGIEVALQRSAHQEKDESHKDCSGADTGEVGVVRDRSEQLSKQSGQR